MPKVDVLPCLPRDVSVAGGRCFHVSTLALPWPVTRPLISPLTTITPLTAPFTIRAAVCSDEVWKHDSRVSVINPVTFRTVHLTVARNRAVVLWCGYGWSRRIVNLWTHTYNFWYEMWGKICAWRSYDPCSYWACSVYWPGLVGE